MEGLDDLDDLEAIRISIASPEQIRARSCGVVKTSGPIDPRTHRPESDGLFCERIFGPIQGEWCACASCDAVDREGTVCGRCGAEITRSTKRR